MAISTQGFLASGKAAGRKSKSAALSLISLMDIFTILVFFLLMNSGESQDIESVKYVKLPDSQADNRFQRNVLVSVSDGEIKLDDKPLMALTDIDGSFDLQRAIGPLSEALAARKSGNGQSGNSQSGSEAEGEANKPRELSEFEKRYGIAVTILADKETPYNLLRRIMLSCAEQNYRDISLAVNQVQSSLLSTSE